MSLEEIVERYVAAWNNQDTDAVLALLHEGAAYYDAFWRESCVGRDLETYFKDWLLLEKRYYRIVGNITVVGDAVVFRYSAHDGEDLKIFPELYRGVEVLTVHGGKILTVTDYYCSPDQEDLEEVALLAQCRHGESKYANGGHSAGRSALVRRQLVRVIESKEVRTGGELTMSQLAAQIGCTVEQVFAVINAEYGLKIDETTDQNRVVPVQDMLRQTDIGKGSQQH